jgi:hypothetical protein
MDVGSAENAGVVFCRRTWVWEVRKMQERFSAEYMDVENAGIV